MDSVDKRRREQVFCAFCQKRWVRVCQKGEESPGTGFESDATALLS